MKLIASYPTSFANGITPSADGATNPAYWATIGWVGGSGNVGDFTTTWVVCSAGNPGTRTVKQAVATGPSTGSTSTEVSVQCPANQYPRGGGFSVDHHSTTYDGSTAFDPSINSGDHLVASFPAVSTGAVWTAGGTATGWGARGHAGGSTSGSSYTHTWAMCTA